MAGRTGTAVNGRVDRLRRALPADVGALLVTDPTNVRYLSGFASTNAVLLVDRERVRLLTDGRYVEAARSVPGVELVESGRDIARYLGEHLADLSAGPVGFEAEHLSYARHAHIAASGVPLVPTRGLVARIRAVKDPEELDAVRRSGRLLDEAFERFARERITGRTEAELAWRMERTIRELGAEAVSFAPIVGSGPNAALPHHHPGSRMVGPGETVVVDAGAVVDGYCSDCTRTFATGPLPPALQRAYEVCLDAQRRSLEAVRAGSSCHDVDAIARNVLRKHGYESMHGLGHGVGLDVHEEPRLTDTSLDTLAAGNVVTVEPGVYLPGLGGVRIEDLVIVGDGEPEVLTPFTKELVTLE
jgi:Xaa-Pro aminopeptidase